MGLFSNSQKESAKDLYQKNVKNQLAPKDGNIHVIMINSFSKWINEMFSVEDKYTNQIDLIVSEMQNDGYEIVDIKFNSVQDQGAFKQMEGFHTLIMYK